MSGGFICEQIALPWMLGNYATKFQKVRPRTTLLRGEFEAKPVSVAYFINEEEVQRPALLRQAFQRTRCLSGEMFKRLGVIKTTGQGPGSSRPAFDSSMPGNKRLRPITQ